MPVETSIDTLTFPLTREGRRQRFADLGWWVSIPLTIVRSHWLYKGEQRLDAGYYTQEATAALRLVKDCALPVQNLKEIVSDIFILERFRRVYASDAKSGWPYLSASDVFEFRPTSGRWLAKEHAPRQAQYHFAKSGWILMSASGTVGRIVLATKRLEGFFLTHDLIRIVPKQLPFFGYLYAYLSTWVGQTLLSKDQYGSAIKHLEPHHLATIPVPLLPEEEQEAIHKEIIRAYTLRDEANDLLDKANEILHRELSLPQFDESLVPYLTPPSRPQSDRPEMPHPKAFTVRASELRDRLDASYHVPVVRIVTELLHKGKYEVVELRHIAKEIFVAPRFKRIYVQKEHGIPFLQGAHLPQIRPYDLKYLSCTQQKHLERLIIYKGWVLVTCSGTIGRVGLVSSFKDKWAASQHLLRIVPDIERGHPGYIAAFLMTPYGQHQLAAKIYGGVVDELTAEDASKIWIPNAPRELQATIGELVVSAYEKKDEAIQVEENAIHRLENLLRERATR